MIQLPMRVAHAEVVDVVDLSPGMRRIAFGGPGLADYASTGVGDEYVRLLFPADPAERPTLPGIAGDHLDYSTIDVDRLRCYTVRAFDPDRAWVTVDFVVHEGGVAATWARQAEVGQVVGINTPVALYDAPEPLDWQVLVADSTGVPAALRLIEQAPAGCRTLAILEVPDAGHELDTPAGAEVRWLHGGNGAAPSALEEVVRSLPRPDGVGYFWVAGEAKVLRGVRKYLRKELGLPASAYKIVGYWTEDADKWRERYDALPEAVRTELESMWDSDRDEEEIEDDYEKRLSELGL